MVTRILLLGWLVGSAAKAVGVPVSAAVVCPFCSAVNLTFSEQMDSHDVVVIAKLLEVDPPSDDPDAEFPKAKLEILEVLKGDALVARKMTFRTQLVGSYPAGQRLLVMGVDPPKMAWSTPMKVSGRVVRYLRRVRELPESGAKRLMFFQDYFEDEESMLAFDAYDEFARASYEDLKALKDQMKRDRLVGWIQDPDTSANRRRLYFTMLGVCGTDDDIRMLEELIQSDDRKQQRGLDALLAAYLTLKGEPGVDLVEKVFLADLERDYLDTSAAVSALRFHGTEANTISKQRIVKAVRHVLDRPKMADMVIADLARWEDWEIMDRLVQMFKDADEESNWLRVPVITYLRACPDPQAKVHIEELKKIDPDSVRRADFFLDGFGDDDAEENESDDAADVEFPVEEESTEPKTNGEVGEPTAAWGQGKPAPEDSGVSAHRVRKVPVDAEFPTTAGRQVWEESDGNPTELLEILASKAKDRPIVDGPSSLGGSMADAVTPVAVAGPVAVVDPVALPVEPTPVASISPQSNMAWMIVSVPVLVSSLLFLLLWSIVNGWFERLIF